MKKNTTTKRRSTAKGRKRSPAGGRRSGSAVRKGKKKNPSWRRTVKATKKSRKASGLADWDFPSRQKQVYKSKKSAAKKAGHKKVKAKKLRYAANPTMKAAGKWIRVKGVSLRVRHKGGKTLLDIRG